MKVQDDDNPEVTSGPSSQAPVVPSAAHLAGTNPPYLGIANLADGAQTRADGAAQSVAAGAGGAAASPMVGPLSQGTTPVTTSRGVLRNYAFGELDNAKYAKLPPQARVIVKAAELLRDQQNNVFTAKDLTDESVKLGLTTRQLPERIIAYYLPRLRQEGFIL